MHLWDWHSCPELCWIQQDTKFSPLFSQVPVAAMAGVGKGSGSTREEPAFLPCTAWLGAHALLSPKAFWSCLLEPLLVMRWVQGHLQRRRSEAETAAQHSEHHRKLLAQLCSVWPLLLALVGGAQPLCFLFIFSFYHRSFFLKCFIQAIQGFLF